MSGGVTGAGVQPNYNFGIQFQQKYADELQWARTALGAGDFDPKVQGEFALASGLPAPAIKDMGDLVAMVQALRQKTEEQNLDVSSNRVENIKQKQADEAEDRLEKLEEQFKKMEQAEKAGVFGKIFGYIASAFMILAGAILCATGVGAGAGAALLAGGITMLTMQLLQEDFGTGKSAMNHMVEGLAKMMAGPNASPEELEKAKMHATAIICGILTAVAVVAGTVAGGPFLGLALATQTMGPLFSPENLKAMGFQPEEDAAWASLGINIGLAVLGVASGAGGAKAIAKAGEMSATTAKLVGGIAGKTAHAAAEAARGGAEVAKMGSQATQILGKVAGHGSAAASGIATVGQGTATITGAVARKGAADAQADLAKIQAEQQLLQRHMEEMQEQLEEIIRRLEEGVSVVMGILNQVGEVGKMTARINA